MSSTSCAWLLVALFLFLFAPPVSPPARFLLSCGRLTLDGVAWAPLTFKSLSLKGIKSSSMLPARPSSEFLSCTRSAQITQLWKIVSNLWSPVLRIFAHGACFTCHRATIIVSSSQFVTEAHWVRHETQLSPKHWLWRQTTPTLLTHNTETNSKSNERTSVD